MNTTPLLLPVPPKPTLARDWRIKVFYAYAALLLGMPLFRLCFGRYSWWIALLPLWGAGVMAVFAILWTLLIMAIEKWNEGWNAERK